MDRRAAFLSFCGTLCLSLTSANAAPTLKFTPRLVTISAHAATARQAKKVTKTAKKKPAVAKKRQIKTTPPTAAPTVVSFEATPIPTAEPVSFDLAAPIVESFVPETPQAVQVPEVIATPEAAPQPTSYPITVPMLLTPIPILTPAATPLPQLVSTTAPTPSIGTPPQHPSVCGDGVIESGESCDDGVLNGQTGHCNSSCGGFITGLDDGSSCASNSECQSGFCGKNVCTAINACPPDSYEAMFPDAYNMTVSLDSETIGSVETFNSNCVGNYIGDGGVVTATCMPDRSWRFESSSDCHESICGNGSVEPSEICDDGVFNGQDGYCDSSCSAKLAAHYEFNWNGADSSANATTAELSGGVAFGVLATGNAYATFDGRNDLLTVSEGAAIENPGAMTISYWVKPDYHGYAGSSRVVLHKGSTNPEFEQQLSGQASGFAVAPSSAAPSTILSAPSAITARYAGVDALTQKDVVYVSWQDNAANEDGYLINVTNQLVSCGPSCSTQAGANAEFQRVLLDRQPSIAEHTVSVQATANGGALRSEKMSVKVRTDGALPATLPVNAAGMIPLDGRWHQVALSMQQGFVQYFLDGNLVSSASGQSGLGNAALLVGASKLPHVVAHTEQVSGNDVLLSWNSASGRRYLIQYKNESEANWSELPVTVSASGNTASYTDKAAAGQYVYQIEELDSRAYTGGLDELMIFQGALAADRIHDLYLAQKDAFNDFAQFYVGIEYFEELQGAARDAAMADLELLARKYAVAWGDFPHEEVAEDPAYDGYLAARWQQQKQFYIDQLYLMERYGVIHGRTAADVLAEAAPRWAEQEAASSWSQPAGMVQTLSSGAALMSVQPAAAGGGASGGQPSALGEGEPVLYNCDTNFTSFYEDCCWRGTGHKSFSSPLPPLVYSDLYGNPDVSNLSTQRMSQGFVSSGFWDLTGDGAACAEKKNREETFSLSNSRVSERARFNQLSFNVVSGAFDKTRAEVAGRLDPVSAEFKDAYDLKWSRGFARTQETAIPNQLGRGAPPWLGPISTVAQMVYSGGRTGGSELEAWMGGINLGYALRQGEVTVNDGGPLGDGLYYKMSGYIDDYMPLPKNQADAAIQGGANFIGALASGVGYRLRGQNYGVDFSGQFNVVGKSKIANLKCELDLFEEVHCKVDWDVMTHGKQEVKACLIYVKPF